jgi:hypothetical protein
MLIFWFVVHPAHIAYVLINEDSPNGLAAGGQQQAAGTSLFTSVIERVGGDPVRIK